MTPFRVFSGFCISSLAGLLLSYQGQSAFAQSGCTSSRCECNANDPTVAVSDSCFEASVSVATLQKINGCCNETSGVCATQIAKSCIWSFNARFSGNQCNPTLVGVVKGSSWDPVNGPGNWIVPINGNDDGAASGCGASPAVITFTACPSGVPAGIPSSSSGCKTATFSMTCSACE